MDNQWRNNEVGIIKGIKFFLLYLFFIGSYYIYAPLYKSFYSDNDIWINIGVFKNFLTTIKFIFSGNNYGTFLFPIENYWDNYGIDFISGVFFIFFYELGFSEVWAYWFHITILLSLNSIALFKFLGHFTKDNRIRFLSALIFSTHHFMFLNLDNPTLISYVFFFLSVDKLMALRNSPSIRGYLITGVYCSLQYYLSPVVFLFLFFSCSLILLSFKHFNLQVLKGLGALFLVIIFMLWPALHKLYLVLGTNELLYFDTIDKESLYKYYRFTSFELIDLIRPYSNHLIYSKLFDLEELSRFVDLKYLFPGFLMTGVFLVNAILNRPYFLIFSFIVIFLIGCGSYIHYYEYQRINNPFSFLFDKLELRNVFRNTNRLNLLILVFYIISITTLFQYFSKKFFNNKKIELFAILILILINLEVSLYSKKVYASQSLIESFNGINKFIASNGQFNSLNIPRGTKYAFGDKREGIYVLNNYHQNQFLVNGLSKFPSKSHIEIDRILNNNPPNGKEFCKLITKYNIERVVVYQAMIQNLNDSLQVELIDKCKCLKKINSYQHVSLYKALKGNSRE